MVERRESPAAIAERAYRQSRFITWMIYLMTTVAFINLGVVFLVSDRSPTILFALSTVLHGFAAVALLYHRKHFLVPILKAAKSRECDATMAQIEKEMHPRR